MNPIEELLKTAQDELELWKKWKESDEHPDHFKPLLTKFQPVINSQVSRFTRNPNVPATRIAFEADKMFLKACQTWDPSQAQLKTHAINYLKKLDRFVGDYSNIGKISEPRRHMLGQFKNVRSSLEENLGRAPTLPEIHEQMNKVREEQGHAPVKLTDLQRLEKEESKRDLSESLAMEDSALYTTPKEQQAIVMMHYSNPLAAGERHTYRLTQDEHEVFKRVFPLNEEGVLELEKTMKLKDIAKELHFSPPKVSRTIKSVNTKLRKATELV